MLADAFRIAQGCVSHANNTNQLTNLPGQTRTEKRDANPVSKAQQCTKCGLTPYVLSLLAE